MAALWVAVKPPADFHADWASRATPYLKEQKWFSRNFR